MPTPSMPTRLFWIRAFPVIALGLVVLSAFRWKDEGDYFFRVNRGLEIFGQIYREVAMGYVDQVDPDTFMNAGIDGMLKTLDPYTVYLDKKGSADIDLLTSGTYAGIGITVGMRDSLVTVTDVVDGYSAQREGVRIGDRIFSINGTELLQGPIEALRDYTRGEPNTTLLVTVHRDGLPKPINFTLTRENIKVKSVSYSVMIGDGIGYIKLDRFGSQAGVELRNAIADLNNSGEGLRGLVLDLRGNPGGLLEAAVDVASKFVPSGSVIVTTKGRDPQENRVYRSTEEPVALGLPLVVLINENSASASEIVAGAVQDLDVGVILGGKSFGKGLVQSVRRLSYDTQLKITTARYYTPSGRCIQKIDYTGLRAGTTGTFLPDTAARVYRTINGRFVVEHGGIIPDTLVNRSALPDAVAWLNNDLVIFRFATRYAATIKGLPQNFQVDDRLLDEFERYAFSGLDSVGGGDVMAHLRGLAQAVQGDKFESTSSRRVEDLRTQLLGELHRSVARNREKIRHEIQTEIATRFRSQRERLTAALVEDHQLQTATALLRNGTWDYGRLLSSR